jgi:predicted anti-sigma-YlaC factor YlaD
MDVRDLDELLRAMDGDAGCAAVAEILERYVDLELAGEGAARVYPSAAIHLRNCLGCRRERDRLVEAARRFADIRPD